MTRIAAAALLTLAGLTVSGCDLLFPKPNPDDTIDAGLTAGLR